MLPRSKRFLCATGHRQLVALSSSPLAPKGGLWACPESLLGIYAEKLCRYVEYIADRRLERIDLPKK